MTLKVRGRLSTSRWIARLAVDADVPEYGMMSLACDSKYAHAAIKLDHANIQVRDSDARWRRSAAR